MATRLKDVAELAGVSIKTVSNVVHHRDSKVSPETRDRIRTALLELNYQPNLAARHLRNTAVGLLALAIPDIGNPYFASVGAAVIDAVTARGYTVLIDHTGGRRDNETLIANGLRPHMIDGVILNPLTLTAADIQPQSVRIPIVLLGERLFDAPYDHVVIDNVAAARLATSHLLSLRRSRIAAIGVPDDPGDTMPQLRLRGYAEALAEAGIALDRELIASVPPASFTREDGRHATQRLLQLRRPPDALFCFNDLVALGAMKALHDAGLRIPEDVAVIGFDDIEEGRYATPTLTTVAPDKREIGRQSVALLLDRIEGRRTGPPERVQPPFHLIVRASTVGSPDSEQALL